MQIEILKQKFIPMSETMLYILMSLTSERHGYGIMIYVKEITEERIILGAGTIYQTLGKLEKGNLIRQTTENDRKKYYIITDVGKQLLMEEAKRISEINRNLEVIL
ncbi:MAG: helix-turn-helix transcriptional regulator [Lachnospiraceae bacterium]|nr:helix-turn-helix transcriptional regulator [Lachnospiraceae bacterium]